MVAGEWIAADIGLSLCGIYGSVFGSVDLSCYDGVWGFNLRRGRSIYIKSIVALYILQFIFAKDTLSLLLKTSEHTILSKPLYARIINCFTKVITL